jgi:threonine aldolase
LQMRKAISEAVVGDDVLGEDPTVSRLEEMSAGLLGKEAAIFVPSGTMANLVSLLTHCGRGDEAMMGHLSHTFMYEAGGASALGGISACTLRNETDGTIDLEAIKGGIRPEDIHQPHTRLLCLENTHNMCGGVPLTVEYTDKAASIARDACAAVHLDGARIFNSAVALGVEAKKLAAAADSVSFCLSKGLGAPVGSVVCGSAGFVESARRWRKMLGGGMRQAGVICAAGIVALETMIDRLSEDHENASLLAAKISEFPGFKVPGVVKTNIVFFEIEGIPAGPSAFVGRLHEKGVAMLCLGNGRIRAVTHCDISKKDLLRSLEIIEKTAREMRN